jgi:hypothetical protein
MVGIIARILTSKQANKIQAVKHTSMAGLSLSISGFTRFRIAKLYCCSAKLSLYSPSCTLEIMPELHMNCSCNEPRATIA